LSGFELIFGAILIIFSASLMAAFYALSNKRPNKRLRPIEAVENLKKSSGLSVEEGKRLHISLGSANMISTQNASALAGLSVLERLSRAGIASDYPPIATSGDSTLSILSQETLKSSYRTGNALDAYASDSARLTGTTPFAYAVGAIPAVRDDKVSTNILIGHFGPEAVFLNDAAEQSGARLIAASDALEGQAVFYAAAQEPLLGEELFALPAYLQTNLFHQTSLRVQDILRWVLITILVLGAILKIVEAILGLNIL
jgi:hypothetical protein